MRKNKAAFVGVVCGVLCAACVFAYTQAVRGEADQQRRDSLARYGGDQVEVCVAKRDIAAGEMVEASAIEMRLWGAGIGGGGLESVVGDACRGSAFEAPVSG